MHLAKLKDFSDSPFSPTSVPGNHHFILCFYEFGYFWYLMYKWNHAGLFLCDWLTSLSICPTGLSALSHMVGLPSFFFFKVEKYTNVFVNHIFKIHSSVTGYLDCFHILATVNRLPNSVYFKEPGIGFGLVLPWEKYSNPQSTSQYAQYCHMSALPWVSLVAQW